METAKSMRRYFIQDWEGELPFGKVLFTSKDEAETFLIKKLGNQYLELRGEYHVLIK